MRMPGYCTECRRVKQVRVAGHALAMAGARHGVVEGVCDECETDREFPRGVHVRHRNTGKLGVTRERAMNGSVLVLWDDETRPERAMTRLLSRR
jgi:hypothetical protein